MKAQEKLGKLLEQEHSSTQFLVMVSLSVISYKFFNLAQLKKSSVITWLKLKNLFTQPVSMKELLLHIHMYCKFLLWQKNFWYDKRLDSPSANTHECCRLNISQQVVTVTNSKKTLKNSCYLLGQKQEGQNSLFLLHNLFFLRFF